jgi:hypothetical protein
MIYKNIFAVISLILSLAVFVPYYANIFKRTARPNIFSWLLWGILTGIGFFLSLKGGGGLGAWIFGLQALSCLGIAVYALKNGERKISKIDWALFIGSIMILPVYVFTRNAALSVAIAALLDFLAFLPTFRKAYSQPHSEPALTYLFSALSFLFSLGALQTYSFVTLFYPSTIVITSGVFTLFLFLRRRTLRR